MSDRINLPAGLFRRLGAAFYDLLLVIALLMLVTGILLIFNGGEAIAQDNPFYPLFLLMICFLFNGWFWTHGGQTLGMRAWRLQVQNEDGYTLTWQQAAVRFACAIAAWVSIVGILWSLIDREKRALHDILSRTELRRVG